MIASCCCGGQLNNMGMEDNRREEGEHGKQAGNGDKDKRAMNTSVRQTSRNNCNPADLDDVDERGMSRCLAGLWSR
jgi:hypothetical protein